MHIVRGNSSSVTPWSEKVKVASLELHLGLGKTIKDLITSPLTRMIKTNS